MIRSDLTNKATISHLLSNRINAGLSELILPLSYHRNQEVNCEQEHLSNSAMYILTCTL